MGNLRSGLVFRVLIGALAFLSGCGRPGGPPPMGPPEVGIVAIEPQAVALSTILPGRTSPFAISDVRPQVSGIVQYRLFEEGSNVRAGQVLYKIDPASYQAAFDQAKALLASAQANLATAKIKSERYADLVKINGVSKQDADDARAAYQQAVATVEQNEASLQSARINLDYTSVKAPIGGRVGKSAFTKGALVSGAQADALTTVQTLDPIYVDINQSSAELLDLRQQLANGARTADDSASTEVSLKLENGSDYPLKGRLQFADVTVDQNTGAVSLRAIFPNPHGVLLPGMYVRAVVAQGGKPSALLVPQQGVMRSPTGEATVMIVDAKGRAQTRIIQTGDMVGDKWLVSGGLKPGDKVIVEGLQRVRPGIPVTVVPVGSPPHAPPAGPPGQAPGG